MGQLQHKKPKPKLYSFTNRISYTIQPEKSWFKSCWYNFLDFLSILETCGCLLIKTYIHQLDFFDDLNLLQKWRIHVQIPRGLTARISGFHPEGPGSTPGVGIVLAQNE